ncbi:Hypothetical predicted protein [Pelobates cultripes]|uniref:Uncharacterized protein n=1 Tax=Pelobates cultripes TaxID=61616 RepID=A0AAD1TDP8_PELCU|nr:Hypothetical predicted protein [Pelobates cultripes]
MQILEKIPEQQDDEQPSTSSHSVYLEKTIDPEGSNDEEEEREELQQEEQYTSLAILDLSDPANWPAVLLSGKVLQSKKLTSFSPKMQRIDISLKQITSDGCQTEKKPLETGWFILSN